MSNPFYRPSRHDWRVIFLAIIVLAIFAIAQKALGQERGYGEYNGYDWKSFDIESAELFSKVDWANKPEWVKRVAEMTKITFILGAFNLSAHWSAVIQERNFNPSLFVYDYNDRISGISPHQAVAGLDKFYSDYTNINIEILEALYIVKLESTGESQETIDFWTRYYRAPQENRSRLLEERFKITGDR